MSTLSKRSSTVRRDGRTTGMPDAAILCLARVMRAATVESGTSNRLAIRDTVRPFTKRRIIATWACGASAGWAHANSIRSRSSARGPSVCARSAGSIVSAARRPSTMRSGRRRSSAAPVRMRSIARRRAVVSTHAGGLSGTPHCGHRRAAASNASCRASSARSKRRRDVTSNDSSRARWSRSSRARARSTSGTSVTSGQPPRAPRRFRRAGRASTPRSRRGWGHPAGSSPTAARRSRRTGRR